MAIFLLHVMMLVAIQPAVAMHFCAGRLHSLNLLNPDDNDPCCKQEVDPAYRVSTEAENPYPNDYCGLSKSHDNCCDYRLIQISTDDYQTSVEQLNAANTLFSFENEWFTLNNLSGITRPETNTVSVQHYFPPGGLFLRDMSLLAYICIYRI